MVMGMTPAVALAYQFPTAGVLASGAVVCDGPFEANADTAPRSYPDTSFDVMDPATDPSPMWVAEPQDSICAVREIFEEQYVDDGYYYDDGYSDGYWSDEYYGDGGGSWSMDVSRYETSQEAIDAGGLVGYWDDYYAAHSWTSEGQMINSMSVGDTIYVDGRAVTVEGVGSWDGGGDCGEIKDLYGWDKVYFQTCDGYGGNTIVYGTYD